MSDSSKSKSDKTTPTRELKFNIQPAAYKMREACAYLGGIHKITMHRLIKTGEIHKHPSVRHVLITKAELDRFSCRTGKPDAGRMDCRISMTRRGEVCTVVNWLLSAGRLATANQFFSKWPHSRLRILVRR